MFQVPGSSFDAAVPSYFAPDQHRKKRVHRPITSRNRPVFDRYAHCFWSQHGSRRQTIHWAPRVAGVQHLQAGYLSDVCRRSSIARLGTTPTAGRVRCRASRPHRGRLRTRQPNRVRAVHGHCPRVADGVPRPPPQCGGQAIHHRCDPARTRRS